MPPLNGDTLRRNLEITATEVSRIGTASKSTGVAKEATIDPVSGFNLIVNVAINTPRNSAPASPI